MIILLFLALFMTVKICEMILNDVHKSNSISRLSTANLNIPDEISKLQALTWVQNIIETFISDCVRGV